MPSLGSRNAPCVRLIPFPELTPVPPKANLSYPEPGTLAQLRQMADVGTHRNGQERVSATVRRIAIFVGLTSSCGHSANVARGRSPGVSAWDRYPWRKRVVGFGPKKFSGALSAI